MGMMFVRQPTARAVPTIFICKRFAKDGTPIHVSSFPSVASSGRFEATESIAKFKHKPNGCGL